MKTLGALRHHPRYHEPFGSHSIFGPLVEAVDAAPIFFAFHENCPMCVLLARSLCCCAVLSGFSRLALTRCVVMHAAHVVRSVTPFAVRTVT